MCGFREIAKRLTMIEERVRPDLDGDSRSPGDRTKRGHSPEYRVLELQIVNTIWENEWPSIFWTKTSSNLRGRIGIQLCEGGSASRWQVQNRANKNFVQSQGARDICFPKTWKFQVLRQQTDTPRIQSMPSIDFSAFWRVLQLLSANQTPCNRLLRHLEEKCNSEDETFSILSVWLVKIRKPCRPTPTRFQD